MYLEDLNISIELMTKDYFLQIVLGTHHSLAWAGLSEVFDLILLNSCLNESSLDFHYRRRYNYKSRGDRGDRKRYNHT